MSTRTRGILAAAGIGGLLLGAVVAASVTSCTGTEANETPDPASWDLPVDKALFDATWPMSVVDDEVRKPLEEPDWVALTFERDIRAADLHRFPQVARRVVARRRRLF